MPSMSPADDTSLHGWNGERLDRMNETVGDIRVDVAEIKGMLKAAGERRWSPTAKSGLAAAFVLAAAPIASLLAVSH